MDLGAQSGARIINSVWDREVRRLGNAAITRLVIAGGFYQVPKTGGEEIRTRIP